MRVAGAVSGEEERRQLERIILLARYVHRLHALAAGLLPAPGAETASSLSFLDPVGSGARRGRT